MEKDKETEKWFEKFKESEEYEAFEKNPVAYFSAEYGLDSSFPTYAGGLGILAGDFIRETAKQSFPLVSVGLLYKKAQSILTLEQHEEKHKLKTVFDNNHQEIIIPIQIEDRMVQIKAFLWQDDKAKVYLLDTDIPENDPRDRGITNCLYDENRDTRLKQEILLGIGGFRLLARLGYHSSVYHLNEGHSAFLALELVRHEMEHQKVSFKEACKYAQKHILFTNHTLVPAGQEQFASEKVGAFIESCAKEICINKEDIVSLGAFKEKPELFSMTNISFRLTEKSNTVSELHLEKAREIWPEEKMENVTNGIFIDRWDKLGSATEENIWEIRKENKRKLLDLVKHRTGKVWAETDLIFVWARRLVEYKQPLLFFNNIDKLIEISKNPDVKVRIIFSGPTGENHNPFVEKIKEIVEKQLDGTAAFIPNYSIDQAEVLTAGADVWLNTPQVGTEACGTSGMKAGLNGALALSTRDGWVHEVESEDVGWVIDEKELDGDIFSIVEKKIMPLYLEHLRSPEDSLWSQKMLEARNLILENFSTTRALKEYIEKLYVPILKQKHDHKIE